MAGYQTPLDIANRACQHCGIPLISSFQDSSDGAVNCALAYDKVREFELQRNMWTFATRRVVLRPMSSGSAVITFPVYASGTTYAAGFVVTYGGLIWYSLVDANLGNTPGTFPTDGTSLKWDLYFGPVVAQPWNESNTSTTSNLSYGRGEIVYITPGDGTYTLYRSLEEGNDDEPDTVDPWDTAITYAAGEVVSYGGTNYQSRVAFNKANTPAGITTQWTTTVTNPTLSRSWLKLTSATLSTAPITYPLTAGPVQSLATRNAYRLPSGYLKTCPEEPKVGQIPWLGGPSGLDQRDWVFEGHWLVSSSTQPIMLRFVANIIDVTKFHQMFAEALSAAIADDIGGAVNTKRPRDVKIAYREAIRDARTQNAIEVSVVMQADDSYISVRS